MIARIRQGVVQLDDADEYAGYNRDTGFTEYAQAPGNRGAWMLRRDQADRTEFIALSLWIPLTPSAPSPATISRPPSCSPRTRGTSSANRR